jgi:molybdopterin synthase sulfur carrier subunit
VASPTGQTAAEAEGIQVTVRYFAAACEAAGTEWETLVVRPDTTVAELVDRLAIRGSRLATVLSRCSYLREGIAVRDETTMLRSGDTIDVLPPFAGG